MQTIKAAVCHEFGQPLVIEDIQLRAPTGSEVEVALDAVAICHSDISYADGGAWGGIAARRLWSRGSWKDHGGGGGSYERRESRRHGGRHADPGLSKLHVLFLWQPGHLRDAL